MGDVPLDLVGAVLPEAVFRWRPSPAENGDGPGPGAEVGSAVSVTSMTLKEGGSEAVLRLRWIYTVLEPGAKPLTGCEERDVTIDLRPAET